MASLWTKINFSRFPLSPFFSPSQYFQKISSPLGKFNGFSSTIASRGCHKYMHTTWENSNIGEKTFIQIEDNRFSKMIDPYCCAMRINSGSSWITVEHIPRESLRFVFFFITAEGGCVEESLQSTRYRSFLIPAGELEVP